MKFELCRNDDLRLDFAKRTTGDGEKVTELGVWTASMSLCNIAGNGHCGPTDLGRNAKLFLAMERTRETIDLMRASHRQLPD